MAACLSDDRDEDTRFNRRLVMTRAYPSTPARIAGAVSLEQHVAYGHQKVSVASNVSYFRGTLELITQRLWSEILDNYKTLHSGSSRKKSLVSANCLNMEPEAFFDMTPRGSDQSPRNHLFLAELPTDVVRSLFSPELSADQGIALGVPERRRNSLLSHGDVDIISRHRLGSSWTMLVWRWYEPGGY